KVAARHWAAVLSGWAILLMVMVWLAPQWESVIEDGEFRYLPIDMPSRVAQRTFQDAFSRDFLGSSVVIVISRERGNGLTDADHKFIEETLKPRLEEIARANGGLSPGAEAKDNEGDTDVSHPTAFHPSSDGSAAGEADNKPLVLRIRTYTDPAIGHLL